MKLIKKILFAIIGFFIWQANFESYRGNLKVYKLPKYPKWLK